MTLTASRVHFIGCHLGLVDDAAPIDVPRVGAGLVPGVGTSSRRHSVCALVRLRYTDQTFLGPDLRNGGIDMQKNQHIKKSIRVTSAMRSIDPELSEIQRRAAYLKEHPDLLQMALIRAGILTRKGKLSKLYGG